MSEREPSQGRSGAMDNCSFDIMTQTEKKADFLHSAIEKYIKDARDANRPELERLWNAIKEDEARHLDLLKAEMAKDVQTGRLK
jgi:hypothetical protein